MIDVRRIAVVLLLLLGTTGCTSRPPTYEGSEVCGVPTDRVTRVAGTDRLEVVERGTGTFPLPANDGGGVQCEVAIVEDGDWEVLFDAKRRWREDLDQISARAKDADHTYDLAGGVAGYSTEDDETNGAHSFEGWWVCDSRSMDGTPMASLTVTSEVDATIKEYEALLEAIATRAGCDAS
ncbi:hypothetical protein [Nocardioides sp. NPDC047086]|uniref:hypothetical protein n=1 Tax=Nocardioides sp. NPDC047086 TaxID=3154810 RepID=UPI00340851B3